MGHATRRNKAIELRLRGRRLCRRHFIRSFCRFWPPAADYACGPGIDPKRYYLVQRGYQYTDLKLTSIGMTTAVGYAVGELTY